MQGVLEEHPASVLTLLLTGTLHVFSPCKQSSSHPASVLTLQAILMHSEAAATLLCQYAAAEVFASYGPMSLQKQISTVPEAGESALQHGS